MSCPASDFDALCWLRCTSRLPFLQPKCASWFVAEHCFYECDVNMGAPQLSGPWPPSLDAAAHFRTLPSIFRPLPAVPVLLRLRDGRRQCVADIAHADPCSRLRPGTLIPIIHTLISIIYTLIPIIHTLFMPIGAADRDQVRSTERSALACPPTPPHPRRSGSKIARTTLSAPAKRAPSSTGQRHAICARRLALHLVAWHCSHPAQSSEPCARAGVR